MLVKLAFASLTLLALPSCSTERVSPEGVEKKVAEMPHSNVTETKILNYDNALKSLLSVTGFSFRYLTDDVIGLKIRTATGADQIERHSIVMLTNNAVVRNDTKFYLTYTFSINNEGAITGEPEKGYVGSDSNVWLELKQRAGQEANEGKGHTQIDDQPSSRNRDD